MRRKKIKFSWEKVTFSSVDMLILRYLHKHHCGDTQKELSERLNLGIGTISKALSRLNNKGILYVIKHPIRIYRLAPERRKEVLKILTGYDFGKNKELIISAHGFIYECLIRELPERFLKKLVEEEDWIEFNPNNWKGYKTPYLDGSVRFHKTKKECKARFYFRTFARDPYIAEMINTQKFLEKKEYLETKYEGLKIGSASLVAKCPMQEVAILRDPLSVKAIELGLKHTCIEDSFKIGGEWEEKGADAVEKIKKIIFIREFCKELDIEESELYEIKDVIKEAIRRIRSNASKLGVE